MRFSTSAPCPWKTLSPTPAVQDMLTWSQSAHELPADQLQYASHAPDREALSKNGQSSRSDRSASVTDKKDLLGHREVCLNCLHVTHSLCTSRKQRSCITKCCPFHPPATRYATCALPPASGRWTNLHGLRHQTPRLPLLTTGAVSGGFQ